MPFFPTGLPAKSTRPSGRRGTHSVARDTRTYGLPEISGKYNKGDLDDVFSVWSYDEERSTEYAPSSDFCPSARDSPMPDKDKHRRALSSTVMGAKPSHDIRKPRTRSDTEQTREQFEQMNIGISRIQPIYKHCFILRKHGMLVKLGGQKATGLAAATTTNTPVPSIDYAIGSDPHRPTDRDCQLIDQAIHFITSIGGEIEIPPLSFESESSSDVSDVLPSTPKNTNGLQDFNGYHNPNSHGYGYQREEHPNNARNMQQAQPQVQNRQIPQPQQPNKRNQDYGQEYR
jgi:hypothetical protein